MPLYRVAIPSDTLDVEQRQQFSRNVVDVHCSVTGAPPSLVHVLFTEPEDQSARSTAHIAGSIRAGRNGDQKAAICRRLRNHLVELTELDPEEIETSLVDVGASYAMERGEVLPEPGSAEEAAWDAQT